MSKKRKRKKRCRESSTRCRYYIVFDENTKNGNIGPYTCMFNVFCLWAKVQNVREDSYMEYNNSRYYIETSS